MLNNLLNASKFTISILESTTAMCASKIPRQCSLVKRNSMSHLMQHHFSQPSEGKTVAVMSADRQSVRCLSVRWLLHFDLIIFICHLTPGCRRPLLVRMLWGGETSPCWQVSKSHRPLIFLSAPCHSANQPSPCHLHLARQTLAIIWLLFYISGLEMNAAVCSSGWKAPLSWKACDIFFKFRKVCHCHVWSQHQTWPWRHPPNL